MGALGTALAISSPGFFDMSTNDMDKYMTSLPEIDTEMHLSTPSTTQEVAVTKNDPNSTGSSKIQSTASSLAVVAVKSTGDNNSSSISQASDSYYQTQEGSFIAVPVTPKQLNAKSDTESTADSTAMEILAEDHTANDNMEMSPTLETHIGMEEQEPDADVATHRYQQRKDARRILWCHIVTSDPTMGYH
jgi:hypothetical protein